MSEQDGLTEEQKNFLQGFAMGSDVARAVRGLPIVSGSGMAPGASLSLGSIGITAEPAQPIGPERLKSPPRIALWEKARRSAGKRRPSEPKIP